jgi:hypothetical protein
MIPGFKRTCFVISLLIFSSLACNTSIQGNSNLDTTVSIYCLNTPSIIGVWNEKQFHEGGFSGLIRIPGTDSIFLTITDRGPNVPLLRASDSLKKDIKFFPFPEYAPTIIRFAIRNGRMVVLNRLPLRFAEGPSPTGLPFPLPFDQSDEIAWTNLQGQTANLGGIGIDAEGITLDTDSTIWITDEYLPALYRVSLKNGLVVKLLSPKKNSAIPTFYRYRRANRGFESVAKLPDGRIVAILQSAPDWTGEDSLALSRLVPILVYNPQTGSSSSFLYETTISRGELKAKDFKISDACAVNNNELLLIETAERGKTKHRMIYRINLSQATDISAWDTLSTSFKSMPINAEKASQMGIRVVEKRAVIDLNTVKELERFEKIEGLCLFDSNTIAIINDNDFGVEPIEKINGFRHTGIPSCLTLIRFPQPMNKP